MTAPFPTERSSGARTPRDRSQVARSLTYIELWDIVALHANAASPHIRIDGHPSQPGQYLPAERRVNPGPFPPDKSGGLIEASRRLGVPRRRVQCFRRINPAASLKLDSLVHYRPCAQECFRRINPAASLKRLGAHEHSSTRPLRFRRINPAASLKQEIVRYAWSRRRP